MKRIIKGYGLLLFSLLLMGAGISLVTLANLGTTPISSLPYVLSFVFPFSFGFFTAVLNTTFVFIQMLIMGRKFPKEQYLQFFMALFFGFSIDLGMFIFAWLEPSTYFLQILLLLIGCVVIAFSILLQLLANVVNNPGEGIVKVLSIKMDKNFGDVKLGFDVLLVIISIAIALIELGTVHGIREGTIVSALLVGPLVKLFRYILDTRIAVIMKRRKVSGDN